MLNCVVDYEAEGEEEQEEEEEEEEEEDYDDNNNNKEEKDNKVTMTHQSRWKYIWPLTWW